MGQQESLLALTGNPPDRTKLRLIFDVRQPEALEQAYRIAMSMASCYQTDRYYLPTYRKLAAAYQTRDPAAMHAALEALCIDIVHR